MKQSEIVEFFKKHKNEWIIARDIRNSIKTESKNLHIALNALCRKGILEKAQIGMYYNFRLKC